MSSKISNGFNDSENSFFDIDLSIMANEGKKAMKKFPKMNLNKIKNPYKKKINKININLGSGNIALTIV